MLRSTGRFHLTSGHEAAKSFCDFVPTYVVEDGKRQLLVWPPISLQLLGNQPSPDKNGDSAGHRFQHCRPASGLPRVVREADERARVLVSKSNVRPGKVRPAKNGI